MILAVRKIILLCGILSSTVALAAGRADNLSWGKAGVSFADYRQDSVACAVQGAKQDITGQDAYREVTRGLNRQEIAVQREDLREYSMIYQRSLRPSVPKIQHYLQSGAEQCLVEKGYVPFRLSRTQLKKLNGLRRGSEERFRFLHALGSDGAVLKAQAAA